MFRSPQPALVTAQFSFMTTGLYGAALHSLCVEMTRCECEKSSGQSLSFDTLPNKSVIDHILLFAMHVYMES